MKNYKSKYKKFCKGFSKYVHAFGFKETDDIKEYIKGIPDKDEFAHMDEVQNYIETIGDSTTKGRKILESNICIAEFMGYEKDEEEMSSIPLNCMEKKERFIVMTKWLKDEDGNPTTSSTDWHAAFLLEYHKSWKWLLPVIRQCFKTKLPTDDIVDGLMDGDIEKTYNAVVEFIK